jgi:hypothetical protein
MVLKMIWATYLAISASFIFGLSVAQHEWHHVGFELLAWEESADFCCFSKKYFFVIIGNP